MKIVCVICLIVPTDKGSIINRHFKRTIEIEGDELSERTVYSIEVNKIPHNFWIAAELGHRDDSGIPQVLFRPKFEGVSGAEEVQAREGKLKHQFEADQSWQLSNGAAKN